MASIFKKTKSPFYFAAFRGANGERIQRTTKQRNRSTALRTAQEWEALATKGRNKTLTEAQARRVVSEIVETSTGEILHFHSCRAWLDEWLLGKRGTTAPATHAKYEQVLRDFLAHLGERAELTLAAIGPRDLRSFRDALAKGGRSASTVNMAIRKTLAVPFLAALRLGYIPMNPCAAVESLRDDSEASRDTFTLEQVAALLAAAVDDWKGAILAGYTTGLRLRDVAELEWSTIDFESNVIRVKTRKTGATLMLPLHDDLSAWLLTQRRGIGKAKVFPSLAGKGTGGRHGLSGRFKAIMDAAGIKGRIVRDSQAGKGRQTSSLSFHSLRHSFVSALANAGVAADVRRKLSGHADDRSHATYTHHELETLRAAVGKVPMIAGAK